MATEAKLRQLADSGCPVYYFYSSERYLVLGSTNLEDLCEKLDLDFESDDYDTIGGYLIGLLDHLPEKNEIIITDDDVLLRVEQMDKNRIEKIYIKKPEPKEEA